MKFIEKGAEPTEFTHWKAMSNDDWQPTYADLSGAVKQLVKQFLTSEQGYICCYCERRLTDDDSHIEHFKPQYVAGVDPLDYTNMLCSCQNQLKKGEPRHCGNLKDRWFDDVLLISPLDSGCESRFRFTGNGEILPVTATERSALETIEHLGLNIPKLKALRASAIELFLDEDLTAEDMHQFVDGYLQKDVHGQYGEFWTTIKHLFSAHATVSATP